MDNNDKTIYTAEGDPIPWLAKDVNNHLDKTTLIFGGTGSGKTILVEEILYLLKDKVPNFLVIAPKTSDKAYRSKLPARCIKEDLTKLKLQQIWNRQVSVTQLYNIANDINVLEGLFNAAPDRESIVMLSALKQRAVEIIGDINRSSKLDYGEKRAQISRIDDLQVARAKEIYRSAIKKNRKILESMDDLTPPQKTALEYLDLNPRFCLIIDDSSEKFKVWMKYFSKSEVNPVEAIFYKNRWNYLTLIIAAHDDKIINTELRKNARVTIYTTSQSLVTSIERPGNGFTAKERKMTMRYANKIFGDETAKIKTYQKLCYIREDVHPFQYVQAAKYPDFALCCESVRDMASKMPSKECDLSVNPYVKDLLKKNR